MSVLADAFKRITDFTFTTLICAAGIPVALMNPSAGFVFLRAWARMTLWLYGIKVDIVDENHGAYQAHQTLFVTLNQTSLSEGAIATYAMPTPYRLIMNLRMALYPVIGWFYWSLRGVVLILPWSSQSKRALEHAARTLKSRANFWMSIEGLRSHDGRLNPYKKGAAVLAIEAHAKIVPIWFSGARAILPYGEWRYRPGKVEITFCRAIETDGLHYEDRDQLVRLLRDLAQAKWNEEGSKHFPPRTI